MDAIFHAFGDSQQQSNERLFMPLLVLAYPKLSREDFDFIQRIRAKEDSLYYSAVDPHFTIVFPITQVGPDAFRKHVRDRSRTVSKFSFVLRCAVVDKDAFNPWNHVFLVPEEGYSRIVKLHDLLYTDILAPELRLDLPFIPHIGVANALDPHHCKRIADSLNADELKFQGIVDDLTIVSLTDNRVTLIETIMLG
jgi:hypothetical protein